MLAFRSVGLYIVLTFSWTLYTTFEILNNDNLVKLLVINSELFSNFMGN